MWKPIWNPSSSDEINDFKVFLYVVYIMVILINFWVVYSVYVPFHYSQTRIKPAPEITEKCLRMADACSILVQ